MKKLGFAALALLLAACGGQKGAEQTGKGDLKGNVHTVQTLIYNARQEGEQVVKDGKPALCARIHASISGVVQSVDGAVVIGK